MNSGATPAQLEKAFPERDEAVISWDHLRAALGKPQKGKKYEQGDGEAHARIVQDNTARTKRWNEDREALLDIPRPVDRAVFYAFSGLVTTAGRFPHALAFGYLQRVEGFKADEIRAVYAEVYEKVEAQIERPPVPAKHRR